MDQRKKKFKMFQHWQISAISYNKTQSQHQTKELLKLMFNNKESAGKDQ